MKRFITIQIIILAVLGALYGAALWSINNDQRLSSEGISEQAKPAEGMKYIEYCSGGVSEYLGNADDTSCLAERPGDFSKFALALYLTLFYMLLFMMQVSVVFYKRLRKGTAKSK